MLPRIKTFPRGTRTLVIDTRSGEVVKYYIAEGEAIRPPEKPPAKDKSAATPRAIATKPRAWARCIHLGAPLGNSVKVRCASIGGTATRYEPAYRCAHPEQPGQRCLPSFEGPWLLPQQQFEAGAYMLCADCPLRQPPAEDSRSVSV